MAVTVVFTCGCSGTVSGQELSAPVCSEHLAPIRRVLSATPRVTGPVQSPLKG